MRVEFSAHAWTKTCVTRLTRARVPHVGLCNKTIKTLDLEVLDYYVCISASVRLVCPSRSGQLHRSSSQSDSRLTETLLGPEIMNSLFFTRFVFHSLHSVTLFVLIRAKRLLEQLRIRHVTDPITVFTKTTILGCVYRSISFFISLRSCPYNTDWIIRGFSSAKV